MPVKGGFRSTPGVRLPFISCLRAWLSLVLLLACATVGFSEVPKRIVIAGRGSFMVVDAAYLFPEIWPRLVAIPKEIQGIEGFLSAIDPHMVEKVILGREAGPEEIAAVKPDVVLLKRANAENLGGSLERIGIPVVCVDFETPENYERDLAILGNLFGQVERAKVVAGFIRRRVEHVTKTLSGIEDAGKPRVLLLYYSSRDGSVTCNVPPKSWMQTTLVKMAGGRPVWEDIQLGQGWTKVNIEQVAAWNPDQIFVVSYFMDPVKAKDALLADERWQALRAVQEKKTWAFPGDYLSWDQPDPRWVLGLTWLAGKMHPTLFSGDAGEVQMVAFYQEFYGVDPETTRNVILPNLRGDL